MKLIKSIYFWILVAFIGGSSLGIANPKIAILMGPLGSNFVKLVKIFIGPLIFLTVATGIAQAGSLKKLGKVGIKAFIYFEIVSTIALLIGWVLASLIKPGSIIHANINLLDKKPIQHFLESGDKLTFVEFLQNLIPSNIIEPFSQGNMLQILFIAMLFGISLLMIGENRAKYLINTLDKLTQSLFQIIRIIMYAAPIGVFGSMSYTIAKFGSHLLIPLLGLIATFYLTGIIFVIGILGIIARISGFSIFGFLKYIASELFLVLGTSSSESVLPQLLRKLENLGCKRETIGVVVPMGYSFNLDGTNIYITLAALFIAQALGIQLTLTQELALFATAMLSSKGAAGVTGAGFITLAATLAFVPTIPAVGMVLILGIDRFMGEARAIINYIGNGVASFVISRWENEVSVNYLNFAMRGDYLNEECNNITSLSQEWLTTF